MMTRCCFSSDTVSRHVVSALSAAWLKARLTARAIMSLSRLACLLLSIHVSQAMARPRLHMYIAARARAF